MESTEQRVRIVIENAFRLPSQPALEYAMGSLPGWDSIGHMQLVVALEQEFGLQIPSYALSEMVDVPAITRVIRENS